MIHFNKQEKLLLISFCCVLFAGITAKAIMYKFPFLSDVVNLMDNEAFLLKVDINAASHDELVRIPYIGRYTADKIIAYRQASGGIRDLEELKQIKGIRDKNFQRFKPYLFIKP